MDRGRAITRALSALAFILLGGAAGASFLPLREAGWLAPDFVYPTLTREPRECLIEAADAQQGRSVAIGRVIFRAPLLLGGQAARAGMSCATCHRNGRGNPGFSFPGLSGVPGTADVTSSLMSGRRGDGRFNPRPIPDLGGSARLKVVRSGQDGSLDLFIHGLVVEEFDGPEPPAEVLAGLAAYVRALRPEACRGGDRPIRLRSALGDVESAVGLAEESAGETRQMLLAAARSNLGAIDERFQLPGLEGERALLRDADRDLAAVRSGAAALAAWRAHWPQRKRRLLSAEGRSLYDRRLLRRMLDAAAPASAASQSIRPHRETDQVMRKSHSQQRRQR